MFARLAIYEQVDVENLEPVLKWFEEHGEKLNRGLAGYQESMTLLDRENARMVGLGLYDTAAHAAEVDAIMDQGAPSEMPEDIAKILMRGQRTHRGIYEVIQR